MRKTEDLSYYLIERVKKNTGKKKSTFIIVRFINNSTGERKDVTLTKLRKLIGDKNDSCLLTLWKSTGLLIRR